MKDGSHDASRVKAIPIGLNDGDNASTDSRFGIRIDNEILVKFRKVTLAIPEMDVRVSVGEGNRRMADGFAVTFKKEDTLANVVSVLHKDVAIKGFRLPKLRRNGNDKDRSRRKKR